MISTSSIWQWYQKAVEKHDRLQCRRKPGKTAWEIFFAILRRLRLKMPLPARTFFGKTMLVLPPEYASCSILQTRVLDTETPAYFRAILKKGMVVFDVGAHFGFYSLLAKTIVGAEGRVHAFEPTPFSFAVLKRNLRNSSGVLAFQLAISDRKGKALFISQDLTGSAYNHIARDNDSSCQASRIVITTETLDNHCAENRVIPNLVKLDVEGHEMDSLLGCQSVLVQHYPAIVLEYGHGGPESLRPAEFLIERGYLPYGARNGRLIRGNLAMIGLSNVGSNFLFVHRSKQGMLS